jgi:hypothetical protein
MRYEGQRNREPAAPLWRAIIHVPIRSVRLFRPVPWRGTGAARCSRRATPSAFRGSVRRGRCRCRQPACMPLAPVFWLPAHGEGDRRALVPVPVETDKTTVSGPRPATLALRQDARKPAGDGQESWSPPFQVLGPVSWASIAVRIWLSVRPVAAISSCSVASRRCRIRISFRALCSIARQSITCCGGDGSVGLVFDGADKATVDVGVGDRSEPYHAIRVEPLQGVQERDLPSPLQVVPGHTADACLELMGCPVDQALVRGQDRFDRGGVAGRRHLAQEQTEP